MENWDRERNINYMNVKNSEKEMTFENGVDKISEV